MPVVRRENDVESPAFPAVEVDSIVERACSFPAQAIVITGGEPSLYPLDYLTEQLAARGLKIFLETSGAHPLSGRFDWIACRPRNSNLRSTAYSPAPAN